MRITPSKFVSYQFEPEGPFIEIDSFCDLHYGAPTFMPDKAKKHRAYVLDHPDRKALDLGDHCENGLRSSPGDSVMRQTCEPEEQFDWVAEYYEPLARDGKLLGLTTGNHEDRTGRDTGMSGDKLLVASLGAPWVRWEAIFSITVGNSRRGQNYTIYVRHAVSNSSKPHVILGAMVNQSRSVQGCDVYAFGHCHMYLDTCVPCRTPDPRHKKIRPFDQYFVMGDSFMARESSYAEQHNYPYSTEGQFAIRLYRDRHEVEIKRLVYR